MKITLRPTAGSSIIMMALFGLIRPMVGRSVMFEGIPGGTVGSFE